MATDDVQRLHYFNGQFLQEPDFTLEQTYHLTHQRDHARLLHTPGIAEGLEFLPPSAGATDVTITAGVAYDKKGQRIVLAKNYSLDLKEMPAGQTVYITIAYKEETTDPKEDTGIKGDTRWTEAPDIKAGDKLPDDPTQQLVLARIERDGNTVRRINLSDRLTAGVKGGDLEVRRLTLSSEHIDPSMWVETKLGASKRVDLGGGLHVTGDLVVDGSITGNIGVNTVETGDLVNNAVTSDKLADGAVTLQKLALAVQPLVSIEGVSNPGGNVDLVSDGAITITPDDPNNRIKIGETHSGDERNPHKTNAAQVGALSLSGGVISGNLGIGVTPSHRLHVVGGDEADLESYGVVSEVNTTNANKTVAFTASANSTGTGDVYGAMVSAGGKGDGVKYGISSSAKGEAGNKIAGNFVAETEASAHSSTQALHAYASTTGSGPVEGLTVKAVGNGEGIKKGIDCSVSGTAGDKVAGHFSATTSSFASNATNQALRAKASSTGKGAVEGLNVSAEGDGAGKKTGLHSSVSGMEGQKLAGYFVATTERSTSNALTQALEATAKSTSPGNVVGLNVIAEGKGVQQVAGQFSATSNHPSDSASYDIRGLSVFATSIPGTGRDTVYGIYSKVTGPPGSVLLAGYFDGNVDVRGALTKTSGSFLIDHPLDPYNQTLRHSFVESPEELCLYRGKVCLDTNGKAVVEMPHYFAELTHEEEATVILTCIGINPFVASYEWNHDFKAFTAYGQPHGQLSYLVMANRDDPSIRVLRRPIEENKPEHQLGTLLFPEAYGQPAPASDLDRAVALRSDASEFTAPEAAFIPQAHGMSAQSSETLPIISNLSPERLEAEIREREAELKRLLEAHDQVERARLAKQQRSTTDGVDTP